MVFFLMVVLSWGFFWFDFMKTIILMEFFSVIMMLFVVNVIALNFLEDYHYVVILVWLVCEASLSFIMFVFFMSFSYELVGKYLLSEL